MNKSESGRVAIYNQLKTKKKHSFIKNKSYKLMKTHVFIRVIRFAFMACNAVNGAAEATNNQTLASEQERN